MARDKDDRYIQQDGNKRYECPACRQPAIQAVTLPITGYFCPTTGLMVNAAAIKSAPELPTEEEKEPRPKTLLKKMMEEEGAAAPIDVGEALTAVLEET